MAEDESATKPALLPDQNSNELLTRGVNVDSGPRSGRGQAFRGNDNWVCEILSVSFIRIDSMERP